jgi:ketosteroid isomerase-like protein
MSQENVAVVRAVYDAFNRRDREAFLAACDPAAEWHVTGAVMDQQRVYRGGEAIWEYVNSFADEFDEFRADAEEIFDAGERIVVALRLHGRGRASGASVDLQYAVLHEVRNGKLLRAENYPEKEQAVGLAE